MRTKLFLIAAGISIVLIVLLTVTITAIFSPKSSTISIVSTTPEDNSKNIPSNSEIVITFNKEPKGGDVRFNTNPRIEGSTEIRGKNYVFIPSSPLPQSTFYVITLGLLDRKPTGVHAFVFQTEGPDPNFPSTEEPPNFVEDTENYQKENYPDVFLANKTPYKNDSFSVSSAFAKTPKEHFYFTVILKGEETKSKNEFLDWLKSQGLTDTQISTLDIRYQ